MKKLLSFILLITFFSCSDDDITVITQNNSTVDAQNETEILAYLSENNLTAQKTDSGLYFIIESEGDGDFPAASSNVNIAYEGYLLNGEVFDQNNNANFSLASLITGFSEATQLLQEGGSGIFLLPASLGYGSSGVGPIPGNAVIIFEIELLSIN